MKSLFFTPGPSQLMPTVEEHLRTAMRDDIASYSHRSLLFTKLYEDTVSSLKKLLDIPADYQVFFLSSATEAWERAIQNCVHTTTFHLVNGAFSKKFYQMAGELGKTAHMLQVEDGEGFNPVSLDIPDECEAVCIVQNETSTGVSIDRHDIYAIKKNFPDKLIMLDIVSSAPYFDIDYTFTDCVLFSVQKGFGLPAGLGVLIVSPRAMETAARNRAKSLPVGSYHSFHTLKAYADKMQTPETPNVLGIYLFNKVIHDMLDKSIAAVRRNTEVKFQMIHHFFVDSPKYHLFVANTALRSATVTVAEVEGGSKPLIERLAAENVIIGSGYGQYKPTHIRIANFPAHTTDEVKHLLEML